MEFFTYRDLIIHIIFSGGLGFLIFFLSYILVYRSKDIEKLSSYECGFDPFETPHTNFEVRYFLVALMFIVFDVEISFLFPWATLTVFVDYLSLSSMLFFFFVLTLGYMYEWRKGAMDFC